MAEAYFLSLCLQSVREVDARPGRGRAGRPTPDGVPCRHVGAGPSLPPGAEPPRTPPEGVAHGYRP